MPQNTPMKRQFTTIDGRTVMSNLPQHWGGNDWAITGVDNPLPVGNYVQTEAGVWIPQKGSDDGAADVRLTGSNVELARSLGTEISAGSTVVVIDYTNVENVSKVYANVVSDSVSHNFDILIDYRIPQRSSGMPNVASLATTINITSNYRGKTGILDVELFEVRIRIKNNHTDTRKYDVFLGGIR